MASTAEAALGHGTLWAFYIVRQGKGEGCQGQHYGCSGGRLMQALSLRGSQICLDVDRMDLAKFRIPRRNIATHELAKAGSILTC